MAGFSMRVALSNISNSLTIEEARDCYNRSCTMCCLSGRGNSRRCETCPVEQAFHYQVEGLAKFADSRKMA